MAAFDKIDRIILNQLQRDSAQSQRDLAEKIGLSQNACWRRLKALEQSGVIAGHGIKLNWEKVGISLVVFAMVRTRNHSAEWLKQFRAHVQLIPEVVGFYRIGGDYDYLLKIATQDMASYDRVYQLLIAKTELDAVTSYFTMESIVADRPVTL